MARSKIPMGADATETAILACLEALKGSNADILACLEAGKESDAAILTAIQALSVQLGVAIDFLADIDAGIDNLAVLVAQLNAQLTAVNANLLAIRILLAQILSAINALNLSLSQILGELQGQTLILGDILAALESILTAIECLLEMDFEWLTMYECDKTKDAYGEPFLVQVGSAKGVAGPVYPGGAACPVAYPGKIDLTPTQEGFCTVSKKVLAFPEGAETGFITVGEGTNTHELTVTTGSPSGQLIINQIQQEAAAGGNRVCFIRSGSAVFTFNPMDVTVGPQGGNQTTITSNIGAPPAGCEDRYLAEWADHVDDKLEINRISGGCCGFGFRPIGDPIPANCTEPANPQPCQLSMVDPIMRAKLCEIATGEPDTVIKGDNLTATLTATAVLESIFIGDTNIIDGDNFDTSTEEGTKAATASLQAYMTDNGGGTGLVTFDAETKSTTVAVKNTKLAFTKIEGGEASAQFVKG